MANTHPVLAFLKYAWGLGFNGWNTENDANLVGLGVVTQLSVLSRTVAAQPGAPANGDRYMIPTGATGAQWAGNDGKVAAYIDGAWTFYTPVNGWQAKVIDEGVRVEYSGSAWVWFGVNDLLAGVIKGCVPSNGVDVDHDLTFTAGKFISTDRVYSLPALTKQFDAAFAEGNNAGGLGNTVTLPTSGAFYIFAISKNASPATVDYYGDTDSAGANVPAGWTVIKEVFRLMTDSSDNFYSFKCKEITGGGLRIRFNNYIQEFSDNNPGTALVNKTLSRVPPLSRAIVGITMIDDSADGATSLWILEMDQTKSSSSGDLDTDASGGVGLSSRNSIVKELDTNSSGQIRYQINNSTADHFIRLNSIGYIVDRI